MPDVVVVIPGILGSVLRQNGREVWGLSAAAGMRAILSLGGSIQNLRLTEDVDDPDVLVDGVQAERILPDLHLFPYLWKIDGYTALAATLAARFELRPGANYFELAYDWRRDNRVAAQELLRKSDSWLRRWREQSGNAGAKLIIVAHSMGGLVARYFLEVLEGWRQTKALVTFGTPYRGSANAVRTLVEGIKKGPLGIIDLSALVRSFTSLYQLLPTYPCLDAGSGRSVHLADGPALPNMDTARVLAAHAFHEEIRQAVDRHLANEDYVRNRYRLIPVVGTFQETLQSVKLDGAGGVAFLNQHAGRDLRGDGTVPRFSATPVELSNQRLESYAATCHASLQNAEGVLHHVSEALAALDLDLGGAEYRAAWLPETFNLALDVEDAFWDNEPVVIRVSSDILPSPALLAVVNEVDRNTEIARINFPAGGTGWRSAELPPLSPGIYRCRVEGFGGAKSTSDIFAVYDHKTA